MSMADSKPQFVKRRFDQVAIGDVIFHKTKDIESDLIKAIGLSTETSRNTGGKHFLLVIEKIDERNRGGHRFLRCVATSSDKGQDFDQNYVLRGSNYFYGARGQNSLLITVQCADIPDNGQEVRTCFPGLKRLAHASNILHT